MADRSVLRARGCGSGRRGERREQQDGCQQDSHRTYSDGAWQRPVPRVLELSAAVAFDRHGGIRRSAAGRGDLAGLRRGWSRSTTASGAAAGASPSTPRASAPGRREERAEKECRVREGRAHAALVYDGPTCVGWCQFGPPTSCRASSTGAPTSKGSAACRSGGSPASSSTRHIGAKGSLPPRSRRSPRDRPARGRNGGELPRGRRGPVGPPLVPPQRTSRCSSAMGSSEPAASARTTGS